MDISALLIDAYDRAVTGCRGILEGIDTDTLHARLTENSNSIAWLVWHIAREQDLQIAHLAGREQVWTADGWAERFDRGAEDFGFGDSPEQVAAFRVDGPEELLGYLDAVREAAVAYLRTLTADDLAPARIAAVTFSAVLTVHLLLTLSVTSVRTLRELSLIHI